MRSSMRSPVRSSAKDNQSPAYKSPIKRLMTRANTHSPSKLLANKRAPPNKSWSLTMQSIPKEGKANNLPIAIPTADDYSKTKR